MTSQLILELQMVLAHPQDHSPELIRDLAEQYAVACVQANGRAKDCLWLLRQGFRGECIRLADLEPNILDEFTLLNFRERQRWVTVSTQLGVQVVKLTDDAVRLISDAYDAHERVKEIASEYRRQNLARRPASERIATLKRLISLDPHNTSWRRCLHAITTVSS